MFSGLISQSTIQSVLRYFRSHDFLRASAMSGLMLTSGCLLYFLGFENCIVGVCIGILLTSFNDIQGSATYRTWAMIINIIINGFIVLIINLLHFSLPLLLLFIALASFALFMFSVYGKRGATVAFSGTLGIVLSLVKVHYGTELLFYVFTIMAGGLSYTIISTVYHLLTRKRQTKEQLGELAKLTSEYLKHRINLAKQNDFKKDVNHKLLDLQVAVIEKQEKLGELILSDSRIRRKSSRRNRQMLLLKELIDFMELAVANPSNLAKIKTLKDINESIFNPFVDLAKHIAERLFNVSEELRNPKIKPIVDAETNFSKAKKAIQNYIEKVGFPDAREGILLMNNLLGYYKLQSKNLTSIEELINDPKHQRGLALTHTQQLQFLKTESYNPKQIFDQLSLKSPIFRHSLRISIAMMLGYLVGELLNVHKVYWIMLTVLMILRSSYGLTIQRSRMRVMGTIIGAIIAFIITQFTTSVVSFVVLAAISMSFAFSLTERNYTLASLAITLNVIFAFALLDSNLNLLIQFRVIDTVIGAVVSLFVALFILPNWEFQNFQLSLSKVIKANQEYWREILNFYSSEKKDDTNYRLKRKAAFLATSNLNSSFQRYKRDPKSKQKNNPLFYDLVTMNHSLLSSLTNLANYLKTHNVPELKTVLQDIWDDIDAEFNSMISNQKPKLQVAQAHKELNDYKEKLESKFDKKIKESETELSKSFQRELHEVHMIQQELSMIKKLTKAIQESTKSDSEVSKSLILS